jgi:hypothetical protein
MERRSTFAANIVGKSFYPPPPVKSRRESLDAAVGNKHGEDMLEIRNGMWDTPR